MAKPNKRKKRRKHNVKRNRSKAKKRAVSKRRNKTDKRRRRLSPSTKRVKNTSKKRRVDRSRSKRAKPRTLPPETPESRAYYYAAILDQIKRQASGKASKTEVSWTEDSSDAMVTIENADIPEIGDLLIDYVKPSKHFDAPWIQVGITGKVTQAGAKHGKEVERPMEYQRGQTKTIQTHATKLPGLTELSLADIGKNVAGLIDYKKNEVRIRLSWNVDSEVPEEMS